MYVTVDANKVPNLHNVCEISIVSCPQYLLNRKAYIDDIWWWERAWAEYVLLDDLVYNIVIL